MKLFGDTWIKGAAEAHSILISPVVMEQAISRGMLDQPGKKQGWAVENRSTGNWK